MSTFVERFLTISNFSKLPLTCIHMYICTYVHTNIYTHGNVVHRLRDSGLFCKRWWFEILLIENVNKKKNQLCNNNLLKNLISIDFKNRQCSWLPPSSDILLKKFLILFSFNFIYKIMHIFSNNFVKYYFIHSFFFHYFLIICAK